jgi:ubiquitin carboxyl-terminal hydrolase 10
VTVENEPPYRRDPIDLMSPSLKRGKTPVRYRLYGVIYHHGLAASGGHYTLDVLHPGPILSSDSKDATPKPNSSSTNSSAPPTSSQGETWVRFDDESVRRLTREDVFGHPGSGVNSPSRRGEREDRVAYLLLYRRVGR